MKRRRSSLLFILIPCLYHLTVADSGYPTFLMNTTFSDPAFLKNMDSNQTHLGFIIKLLGMIFGMFCEICFIVFN
jgi:hypothetical protein